jgi:hypothetical protein
LYSSGGSGILGAATLFSSKSDVMMKLIVFHPV